MVKKRLDLDYQARRTQFLDPEYSVPLKCIDHSASLVLLLEKIPLHSSREKYPRKNLNSLASQIIPYPIALLFFHKHPQRFDQPSTKSTALLEFHSHAAFASLPPYPCTLTTTAHLPQHKPHS